MNRFRLVATLTMVIALAGLMSAQQAAPASGNAGKEEHAQGMASPSAEDHLKMLTEKLDLTADQQTKIRPILQKMLDARQKVMQDNNLSDEARQEKMKSLHEDASKKARKYLNEDQKKKLDELEQQPHP